MQPTEKQTEQAIKKQVRIKMFFVGLVVLTIILLVVANSLAWFNNRKEATANGINATVQQVEEIRIAGYPADGNWNPYLEVSCFDMQPICGDAFHFYAPIFSDAIVQSTGMVTTKKKLATSATLIPG